MEQTAKKTVSSHLSTFIVKFRLIILITLGALIFAAIAIGVILSISSMQTKSGLTSLDDIELRLTQLDTEDESFAEAQSTILTEAKDLAQKASGVVKVRSYIFAADIDFELENWSDARESYMQAFEADSIAYTAPISLYNAAICSEELEDYDVAVEYFQLAVEYENFALSARALFNIGRIEESRENYQEATGAYQSLNDDFPGTDWANLGKSRLIALETKMKVQ